jgi:hypothetical protein
MSCPPEALQRSAYVLARADFPFLLAVEGRSRSLQNDDSPNGRVSVAEVVKNGSLVPGLNLPDFERLVVRAGHVEVQTKAIRKRSPPAVDGDHSMPWRAGNDACRIFSRRIGGIGLSRRLRANDRR